MLVMLSEEQLGDASLFRKELGDFAIGQHGLVQKQLLDE